MARQLIEACVETNMTQAALMFVDGNAQDYDFGLPSNWTREISENIGVGPAMQKFYRSNPALAFYGWLADDFLPTTRNWDVALSRNAGETNIAFCEDRWSRHRKPTWITSAVAIGGDLVRAVGWFAPPVLRQAGIDSAWNRIGRRYNLQVFDRDIVVVHRHWKNGKRKRDAIDNDPVKERPGWKAFLASGEMEAALARVEDMLNARGLCTSRVEVRQ